MKNGESKSTKGSKTLDSILTDISTWRCSNETLTQVRSLLKSENKISIQTRGSSSLLEKAKQRKTSRAQQSTNKQTGLAEASTRQQLHCAIRIIKSCLIALTSTSNASKSEQSMRGSADRAAAHARVKSTKQPGKSEQLQVITDCCVVGFEAWTSQVDATKLSDIAMTRSNFITRLQEHQLVSIHSSQSYSNQISFLNFTVR